MHEKNDIKLLIEKKLSFNVNMLTSESLNNDETLLNFMLDNRALDF